jgi:NAD(P)-dependent dehydrogenase (short-subunit alcohol dehydrogenase family)
MDRVVVITGAGQGIGRTVARMYGQAGAILVLADKNRQALAAAAEELTASIGRTPYTQTTDVQDPQQVLSLFAAVRQRYARIDVLINNAGIMIRKDPMELSIEQWDEVMHTNLRGTFLCARAAAQLMKEHGGGSIVNIASTRAMMSEPHTEAYAASKGGIVSLTHALAISLGPYGIRVNAISPGWIENGDWQLLRQEDHRQHPAGRVGRSEDVGRACFYLTDRDNDFVTGTHLVVDGGMTRKMIYEPDVE